MKKRLAAVCAAVTVISVWQNVCAYGADDGTQGTSGGNIYYVSSIHGKGGNDGSKSRPYPSLDDIHWNHLKPGDQVLLERGSVFEGFIHLTDVHGTKDQPIVIGAYGVGEALPRIDGKGQGIWYQDYGQPLDSKDHKYRGYVSSTVLMYDCDYMEIKNLEITNQVLEGYEEHELFQPGEAQQMGAGIMDRTGVSAVAKNHGTMEHIYLEGLNIHHVSGNLQDKHMNNGGIQMNALKPENESLTGVARYNDVRITGCQINDVSRTGIGVGYTYQWSMFSTGAIDDTVAQTYGHTNLYIANNYVKDAGGDSIVVMYGYQPLTEYNVSHGAGADLKRYAAEGSDAQNDGWQRSCVGILPWKCKDAVFRYNEAFNTVGENNVDGQAWNIHSSDGTVYQYNYSHNNGGGSVQFCSAQAVNGVFRYNLSVNDLGGWMTLQNNPNAKIYNNVFYTDEGSSIGILHSDAGKNGGSADIFNNIFFREGTAAANDWNGSKGTKTYSNNLYFGVEPPSSDKAPVIVSEAQKAMVFQTPAAILPPDNGVIQAWKSDAFNGFRLQSQSPALKKGKALDNGEVVRDFFGNMIGAGNAPDIGMHQLSGTSASNVLYSRDFSINDQDLVISNIPYGISAANFKARIISSDEVALQSDGSNISDKALLTDSGLTMETNGKKYRLELNPAVRPVRYIEYSREGWTADTGSEKTGLDKEGLA